MSLEVLINGVDLAGQVRSITRRRQLHAVATCKIVLEDLAAAVRPRSFQPVSVTYDGEILFRGEVARPALGTVVADTGRLWTIDCRDDTNQRAQRVFRNGTEPAGEFDT